MPTDKERREVAENLRNLTIGRSIQYKEQFFDELAEVVVGFEDYHDFYVVLEKLTDLIDPTDETCEAELTDTVRTRGTVKVYECSKCGKSWEQVWADDFTFCPYCGRRIEHAD
jgi:NAD-dependent SIR2 family protein deacetylase